MIFTDYKPIGVVCGDLIKNYDAKKIAFCNKLDPMARGIITILTDEDTKQMEDFMKHGKTYEVKFIIGITTDTDDILGMIENNDMKDKDDVNTILEHFNEFPMKYDQQYHRYSSFVPPERNDKNKRMPMWWWSQHGYTIHNVKTKEITFHKKEITSVTDINGSELKDLMLFNINKLKSDDFRKKDILNQWNEYSFKDSYIQLDCTLSVSSGFYVRQFIRDLSIRLNTRLLVTDIHRVNIF